MNWLPLITLGVVAFAATNMDDILLLVLFFGDRRFRARDVFIGQAMGIGLLVIISLILGLAASAVPRSWVGLLGILPVLIGARELIARREGVAGGGSAPRPSPTVVQREPGRRRAIAVAGVTLANGADNIGVYTPLFATRSSADTLVLLVVFIVMLWVWLYGAFYLARLSAVADRVQRFSHAIFPYALIALGMIILVDGFLFLSV